MSIIVTVHVNEGIVMASDSRISITTSELVNDGTDGNPKVIKEEMAHFSDTTYKTYLMDNSIGISSCGNATINNAPIAGYIESFIRENSGISINKVPQKILAYFQKLEPNKNTTFFVAGYDLSGDQAKQCVFRINTKADKGDEIEICDTSFSNAVWDGVRDVPSRLFTELYIKSTDANGKDEYTKHSRYPLALQQFTLQDAIEFAEFVISATISSMKFQKRPKTVGGPVDILVIKPETAFWIQRKELHP